jgi:ubiquitin C-terminal hydrolase
MSLLNHAFFPIDPYNFLRALEHNISPIRGTPFQYNTQQDVPEILRTVLDDFKGISPLVDGILSTTLRSTITCDTCLCSSVQEEKCDMLNLQTKESISASLNQMLEPESLSGENVWFCALCSEHQTSTKETRITSCAVLF